MSISFTVKKSMIIAAVRQALHETGEAAFLETKKVVPVVTGELKGSGSVQSVYDGVIIRYTKEYASFVERDWEGGRIWTNPYVRIDGIRVRGHYKNQPPRKGQKFIENSLRKFFMDEVGSKTPFQENVLIALKTSFVGRKIEEI